MIDVSQSVEHDHPHALEFLRKDCTNTLEYFRKRIDHIPTLREIFDFVVSDMETLKRHLFDNIVAEEDHILDDYIAMMINTASLRPEGYSELPETLISESVFKNVFIPRTLEDVEMPMEDIAKIRDGNSEQVLYASVIGLNLLETKPDTFISQDDDSSTDEESSSYDETDFDKISKLKKHEDKDEKKERKEAVRLEKQAKRLVKVPKSEKKRKLKISQGKK